jgi:hypothetical protein
MISRYNHFILEKNLINLILEAEVAYYEDFKNLTYHDNNILGLLSAMVMSMANDFIGSAKSTFTVWIHQERCVNGLSSFKYFGNEYHEYDENFLPYSWNSLNLGYSPNWEREWKECYLNV